MLKFLSDLWSRGLNTYQDDGWEAYNEGYALIDNPHIEGSYAYAEWRRGWKNADYQAGKPL